MGWCGATNVMDTVIDAVDELLTSMRSPSEAFDRPAVDAVLRPFVRRVAAELRDHDWDCVDESDYYDRFAPELEGVTDVEFRRIQAERYAEADDAEGFATWLRDVWEPQGRETS